MLGEPGACGNQCQGRASVSAVTERRIGEVTEGRDGDGRRTPPCRKMQSGRGVPSSATAKSLARRAALTARSICPPVILDQRTLCREYPDFWLRVLSPIPARRLMRRSSSVRLWTIRGPSNSVLSHETTLSRISHSAIDAFICCYLVGGSGSAGRPVRRR